jgi:hypothetical protein
MEKTKKPTLLDTISFIQPFGDTSSGQRIIDAQTWSGTEYVGTTMNGDNSVRGELYRRQDQRVSQI